MKVNKFSIRDQRGWNVHHSQMRELLGLPPKAKLPVEGMAAREIQGVKVWVEPFLPVWGRDRYTGERVQVKSSVHRVKAECPNCRKVLSAGRLFQHTCG
jgi:hypothetical protein